MLTAVELLCNLRFELLCVCTGVRIADAGAWSRGFDGAALKLLYPVEGTHPLLDFGAGFWEEDELCFISELTVGFVTDWLTVVAVTIEVDLCF